jgi:uridine kinase
MIMDRSTTLVAIVGGSGAGKTWLADRLQHALGSQVGRLTLDDFYLDRSYLSPARRSGVNFDHPRAIDWPLVERVLDDCRAGRPTRLPRYSFAQHTRLRQQEEWVPPHSIVMDGLWLLLRASVRSQFDLCVFLECPARLRLERRLSRDIAERARAPDSVREQFWKTVAPMHELYVAPQVRWADIVLTEPPSEEEIQELIETVRTLKPAATTGRLAGRKHSVRGEYPVPRFQPQSIPGLRF